MLSDFGAISYIAAALTYTLLAGLVAARYLRRNVDRTLFLAAIASALLASGLVSQSLFSFPGFFVRYLLELLRYAAWIAVLFAILQNGFRHSKITGQIKGVLGVSSALLLSLLIGTGLLELALDESLLSGKARMLGQIGLALLGLSLVEQIWRNSPGFGRSGIKYICIGVATLFAFDFFMYADALLFGQVADSFWDARGFVNALLVPLFAVNVINTRKQPVDFQLSRSAVFHTGTLVFAGGYLLCLAIGGYYVRILGGTVGEALQVLFFTIALAFLATLVLSRRIRAKLMVLISRNFFDYKYDYREEWLKISRELADLSDDPPLPERVTRILAGLVESNSGAIWLKNDQGTFVLKASVNQPASKHTLIDSDSDLAKFFKEREWVINLNEYKADPVRYDLLEIPDAIAHMHDAWLLIPMFLGNELYGITLVGSSYAKVELNWENFDLIKVVARQACNLLAQADTQSRLSRAMQFEAVSKASAFMIHDLKTVIAQLSLLVKNAPKHRNNPAFIDDMIKTTDHAVRKMSRLVSHLRQPADTSSTQRKVIDLTLLCRELAKLHSKQEPAPRLEGNPPSALIEADQEQLASVLGHLIQNAQDATSPTGEVNLTIKLAKGSVVLFIQDTGSGMSEQFINSQLFKPFESTKGLTGMGIGAFQAREYIQELGGSIDVSSELGVGSCFSIKIPLAGNEETAPPEQMEDVPSLPQGAKRVN